MWLGVNVADCIVFGKIELAVLVGLKFRFDSKRRCSAMVLVVECDV
jgi:hypothetical protein